MFNNIKIVGLYVKLTNSKNGKYSIPIIIDKAVGNTEYLFHININIGALKKKKI